MSTGNIGPMTPEYCKQKAAKIMKYQHDLVAKFGLKEDELTDKLASGEIQASGGGDQVYLNRENLAKVGISGEELDKYRFEQNLYSRAKNDVKLFAQLAATDTDTTTLETAFTDEAGAETAVTRMRQERKEKILAELKAVKPEDDGIKLKPEDIEAIAETKLNGEFTEEYINKIKKTYKEQRYKYSNQLQNIKNNEMTQKRADAEKIMDEKIEKDKRKLLTQLHDLQDKKEFLDAKLRAQKETLSAVTTNANLSNMKTEMFKELRDKYVKEVKKSGHVNENEVAVANPDDVRSKIVSLEQEIKTAEERLNQPQSATAPAPNKQ